ncbi:cysteinyl-tRNA synthetase [Stygiomarasmius scandens]|uniref:Cysteinyl-tRNA synthetase n=1 Tax=Marasmiellus scandens TaxID=2682957 RepID=A0ABR1J3A6_9AGAR
MSEVKSAQELMMQLRAEDVVDESRLARAGAPRIDVEASRKIVITPWEELSPTLPPSPPATKSKSSFSKMSFSNLRGSQSTLNSSRPSLSSYYPSQSTLTVSEPFPEEYPYSYSSSSLPKREIRKSKSSFFPKQLSNILPGRSKHRLRVDTYDIEHPSLRPKTPPLPDKYFSSSERRRKISRQGGSFSQPQSPSYRDSQIVLDTNTDDMEGIVDLTALSSSSHTASGSTSPSSVPDSSSYSQSLSDHSISSTLHSAANEFHRFHDPFGPSVPKAFSLEASKRHAMVDQNRKVSPTTIVPPKPPLLTIPQRSGRPHGPSDNGGVNQIWTAPESWKVQPEVETPGEEGNGSSEEDFFSHPRPFGSSEWPPGSDSATTHTLNSMFSQDGSETCVSAADEFGKFFDDESLDLASVKEVTPRKGTDARSIRSPTNLYKSPSSSTVTLTKRQPPQSKSFRLKVFRGDKSFHIVTLGVQINVTELTQKLTQKQSGKQSEKRAEKRAEKLDANLLPGDERMHRLYLVERGKERMLTPFERPVEIVKRRLEWAGYDMKDGNELLGPDGLSFLLKFVYKTQLLGPTDMPLEITDFERVDLSGRSLRTIPIVLHHHADQIVTLYLSGNPMLEIPLDFIQSCTTLKDLRLSNMAMKKVPRSVQACATLSRLDISSNRIADLEETYLERITGLTTLLIRNNRLKNLPWHFPRLRSLVTLNLSSNKFQTLPIVVCELENLRDLDISFNMLYELPRDIGRLTKLEHLVMVGNQISKLPDDCNRLVNLRRLDCRWNSIKDLNVITMLPKLEKLSADHNSLHELGLSLGPNVSIIDASRNEITRLSFIPGPIGRAPYSLISLDISHAKLSTLDDAAIAQLTSLRTLRLDHNAFRFIPESIGTLKWLETLSCSYNQIETLPSVVGKLKKLEVLEIHNNSLTELPITLWDCDSLRKINATSNLISSWQHPPLPPLSGPGDSLSPIASPRQFAERKASLASQMSNSSSHMSLPPLAHSLEKLYLGENHIADDLVSHLMLLRELKVLNLSFNEIQELPFYFFRSFSRLEELYLSGNKLTTIPTEDLPKLKHLTTLFLNGNKLQNLPQELGKVVSLKVLDVGSNSLKYNINNWEFDWNWNFNKNLRYLNLSGNKKLQIKSDTSVSGGRRHSRSFSLTQHALAGFGELTQLRVLGLMDVTITTTGQNVEIPDETDDRRVRSSESTVLGMAYGIADTLGKNSYLNMLDLVHAFPDRPGQAVFAMFGKSVPWKTLPARASGNRIPKFLRDHFIAVFRTQLADPQLKASDALRRSFLKLNYELHNNLFNTRKDASVEPLVRRGGASGIVLYFDKPKRTMFVANVGDALAVVSRGGIARPVSRKHDPYDEQELLRIKAAEGWISPTGLVNDEVDVSRSFGFFHIPYVINAQPSIVEWNLSELDEFVIVGAPSLWQYVSFQTAVDIARRESDPMIASQKLRDFALSYGAEGTTMIMVISVADLFKPDESRTPKVSLADTTHIFKALPRLPKDDIQDRVVQRLQDPVPPPVGHLALVFTDIRNSTHLWDVNRGMNTAWRLHNNLLRRLLRFCGGYEVKTEGDAFMCAFSTTLAAVWWCLSVQAELLNESWPLELLECEDGKPIYHPLDGRVIAKGISVRMGIHCGSPLCETDPVNHRMDYFGPMVNRAARVNGHAAGGQIMCSADVMREIHAKVLGDGPLTPYSENQPLQAIEGIRQIGLSHFAVGEVKLKGLELPEMISVIYPEALAYRHEIQEYLAAPSDWTSSRVQFNVSQTRQLGMVCLRLEALASSRIFREISERKISVQTSVDAEQEEEEDSLYLYGDPNMLLPVLNDKSSEMEMTLALDVLAGRIENAVSKLKEMSGNSSLKNSLSAALRGESSLDERTLQSILDLLDSF